MQLELSRRDVANHHSPRSSAGPACPGIQHTIAVANVLAEKPQVHLESYAVHGADVESLPLEHAVLVVEACDVLGVVRNAGHCGEHRTPATRRRIHRLRECAGMSLEPGMPPVPDISLRHRRRRLELAECNRGAIPERQPAPSLDCGVETRVRFRSRWRHPATRDRTASAYAQSPIRLFPRRLPLAQPHRGRMPPARVSKSPRPSADGSRALARSRAPRELRQVSG